jgi:hypothetical protein
MNEQTRARLKQSSQDGLLILTGAGISRPWPSSLPLGRDITHAIAELVLANANLPPAAREPDLAKTFLEGVKSTPMELMWESLVRTVGESVLNALAVMHDAPYNINHAAIAHACRHWRIPAVFTLNFDILQERAIAEQARMNHLSLSTQKEFTQLASIMDPPRD